MQYNINFNKWINSFIKRTLEQTDYLNGLDTAIGDGDHGDNMEKGVLKLASYIEMYVESSDESFENPKELFNIMSVLFLSNINGASGPLYAVAFKNMSQTWGEKIQLEEVILSGVKGIQKLGHCEVGDKTMLDVWHGVYNLLNNNILTTEEIQKQVLSTKYKVAKKGRASYFGDRSIGHIDPGAQSSGYFFEAMLEAIEKKNG